MEFSNSQGNNRFTIVNTRPLYFRGVVFDDCVSFVFLKRPIANGRLSGSANMSTESRKKKSKTDNCPAYADEF